MIIGSLFKKERAKLTENSVVGEAFCLAFRNVYPNYDKQMDHSYRIIDFINKIDIPEKDAEKIIILAAKYLKMKAFW